MNQSTKQYGVGFAALTIFILSTLLIGCPTIYQIPPVHFPPPYANGLLARDITCPVEPQQPAQTTPQFCRISGSTGVNSDCNTYAPPNGATSGSGLCDTGNRFCPGYGTCTYAATGACYAGQLRYCDLDNQNCDPLSSGSRGCGAQPCLDDGTGWATTVCNPLGTTCGLGNQACCAGGLCYDGFACAGNSCVACGLEGGPCCSNSACGTGLTCAGSSATCVKSDAPGCGLTQGSACCFGSVACASGMVCVSGSCNDVVCTANASDCGGPRNAPRQCNPSGTAWINGAACASGQACLSGACTTITGRLVTWSITTGGDDLRGGSNAVLLLLDFQGNVLERQVLSTGGWSNGSVHTGNFAISPTTVRSKVADIWLKMEQAGNDNWNVNSISAHLIDSVTDNCLVTLSGNPLVRLNNNAVKHLNPGAGCP